MPVLDGVRIGPLDPDRAENFGQVGGQTTARHLIRHHVAMYPAALLGALSRVRHDVRSGAIDREEAEGFIRKVYDDAGEALPEESQITGYAVRGLDEQPELQVVTFTFTTKGGRTGKGFVPYRELSKSVEAGDEAVRIDELKKAGLPWAPSEAALSAAGIRGTGVEAPEGQSIDDVIEGDRLREENEGLRSELEELRERLAEVEGQRDSVHTQTVGGGSGVGSSPETPEGGSASVSGTQGDGSGDDAGSNEPEDPEKLGKALGLSVSYDDAKAQDVRHKLRESGDADLARRVLDFETRSDGGQNRSTVTTAANEILDRKPAGDGQ